MARTLLCLCLLVAACAGAAREQRSARSPSSSDLDLRRRDDRALYRAEPLSVELDYVTRAQERADNAAKLLINHEGIDQRIANARDAAVILAKVFIFNDDEVGRRVASVLRERARAGAFVVLQYDVKGSIRGKQDLAQMRRNASADNPMGEKDLFRDLRRAGVQVIPTNSPLRAIEADEWANNVERLFKDPLAAVERSLQSMKIVTHIDHEKYWITGHRGRGGALELRAILGGTNIASEYGYGGTGRVDADSGRGGWRDTDVELRGPVVNDIVLRYFELMDYHRGQIGDVATRARWNPPQGPAGKARVRFVWNQPLVDGSRRIEGMYTSLINATPRGGSVRAETAYFAPGGELRRALRAALERGVRLTVLTNSEETNDITVIAEASRGAFYALLKVDPSAALLERRSRPDLGEHTLHSKIASFGTHGPVIIGSSNLDSWSMTHNSECAALIDDPDLRAAFDRMFARDIAPDRADRITKELVETEPAWARIRQWAVANLIAYWG